MTVELSGYSVDNTGVVYGVYGKPLTQYDNNGYKYVRLSGSTHTVHSLVAKAFLGERPDGYHIHHKDGDPSNNRLDNLEYLTPKEHAERHMALREKDREEHNEPNDFIDRTKWEYIF